MADLLERSLDTAEFRDGAWHDHGHGSGSAHGHYVKWLTFSDLKQSVVQDVRRIREHPLVPPDIPIYGYYFDVKSGRLVEVPEATNLGRALGIHASA